MPASSSTCASLQAVKGVLVDGFRITALPAAKAGAILCATVFNGALNGVMAATIPRGTRRVKARRPFWLGAPATGTTSPDKRLASSPESLSVWMQRDISPLASAAVKPAPGLAVACIHDLRQRLVEIGIVAENGEGNRTEFHLSAPETGRALDAAPDLGAPGEGEEPDPLILDEMPGDIPSSVNDGQQA